MAFENETNVRYLTRARILNVTKGVRVYKISWKHTFVGIFGAIAYSILDLSDSVKSLKSKDYGYALSAADELARSIREGDDLEIIKENAKWYAERRYGEVQQRHDTGALERL